MISKNFIPYCLIERHLGQLRVFSVDSIEEFLDCLFALVGYY